MAVLAAPALGVAPAHAQDPAPAVVVDEETPLAEVPPARTVQVDPVLDAVEVVGTAEIDRADDALAEAAGAQSEALLRWLDVDRRRAELVGRAGTAVQAAAQAQGDLAAARIAEAEVGAELERLEGEEALLRIPLEEERELVRRLAAEALTTSAYDAYAVLGTFEELTEADRLDAARDRGTELQGEALEEARRPWAAARRARRAQERRLARAQRASAAADDAAQAATDERDRFDQLLAAVEGQADEARARYDDARADAQRALAERRLARLGSTVRDADLPLVALHAYWRASALAPCAVPWWALAGIGRSESRHGSAQGSELTPEGDTTKRILGIPLDGRPGTQAIGDTDGGRLDDDSVWDRAVGPMQFIPGTWGRWASDGDASTDADPHNLYDAALAAARYLCFGRTDLTDEAALRGALLSYNRSVPYGTKVIAEGRRYAEAVGLPDLPGGADGTAPEDLAATAGD